MIDSLSTLINQMFPKTKEMRNQPKGGRSPRTQVLQSIITSLQKLAATRDMVIVILAQCATRMQAEQGASLIPSINANLWDQGITTRLVLFRDWVIGGEKGSIVSARFAALQKLNGKAVPGGFGDAYAFSIHNVSSHITPHPSYDILE